MKIFCCSCNVDIEARLTSGREIYSQRKDLSQIPFWVCDTCNNYVGCHHKSSKPLQPLGCIPTAEIKKWRSILHTIIDPLWQGKDKQERKTVYRKISTFLGYEYHSAEIRSVEEAKKIYAYVKNNF